MLAPELDGNGNIIGGVRSPAAHPGPALDAVPSHAAFVTKWTADTRLARRGYLPPPPQPS